MILIKKTTQQSIITNSGLQYESSADDVNISWMWSESF